MHPQSDVFRLHCRPLGNILRQHKAMQEMYTDLKFLKIKKTVTTHRKYDYQHRRY